MGNDCCRKDVESEIHCFPGPESTQPLTPPELVSEKATPMVKQSKIETISTEINEILHKYISCSGKIAKVQALFKGKLTRRGSPVFTVPLTLKIIKYISWQLNTYPTNNISKLEPLVLDWSVPEYNKSLELKKATQDAKNNVYAGYRNKSTNKREGYGQEAFADGGRYEGFWKDDEYHGQGRFISSEGDCYTGEWRKGKADGYGTFVGYDGIQYIGEWKEDEHHGKGKEIWPDGSVFEGIYVRGEKEGNGKFAWSDKSEYVGSFEKSQMSGKGIYTWSDGRLYNGEWKDNKMNGQGIFKFPDGKVYEGELKDDVRQGYGVMTWPDGRKYAGLWENGKMHGKGQIINTDKSVIEGEWFQGTKSKEIALQLGSKNGNPKIILQPLEREFQEAEGK